MPRYPFLSFHVAEIFTETFDLTTEELGAYFKLVMVAWQRDGCLPPDETFLRAHFPSMHGLTFNRVVRKILARFFELTERGYENEMVTNAKRKAEERSENAKRNAEERWSRVNKNKDLADATAMLTITEHNITEEESKKERKNIINPDIREESFPLVQEELESWASEFPLVKDIPGRLRGMRKWLSQFDPLERRDKFVLWLAKKQREAEERKAKESPPPLWQRDAYKQDVEREQKEKLRVAAGPITLRPV